MSIQLVARARRAGWALTPRDVFTHRTVAALARVARPAAAAAAEHRDAGIGDLPALPVLHWLSGLAGPVDDLHQSAVLRVPAGMDLGGLTAAVQAVLDRHDALRMRWTAAPGPRWALDIGPRGSVRAAECVRRVDAAGLAGPALRTAVAAEATRARAELSPGERRMLRCVWLDRGPRSGGRLLILAHHGVVDEVSWRILVPDLRAAFQDEPRLLPVPFSLRTWSHRMAAAATEPDRVAEAALWTEVLRGGPGDALPAAGPQDVFGAARSLSVRLGPADTAALLTAVPAAFRADAEDAMLTALAMAVTSWRPGPAGGVLVDVEGHGRQDLPGGADLSRTVGWFTTLHPERLDPKLPGWERAGPSDPRLGAALKRVKEQRRRLPDRGLGYGLLRYLNPRTAAVLAAHPAPRIGFNYLGRVAGDDGADWSPAPESDAAGPGADPRLAMPHTLGVTAAIEDGPDGPILTAAFAWPDRLLTVHDVRALGEAWLSALRLLGAHAARPGAGGLTPSDVRPAEVGQEELSRWEASLGGRGLADVLPLTPLQEGLLFHARYDRAVPDVYHLQLVLELDRAPRVPALRAACQALVDRHAALRAAFPVRAVGAPVQLIPATVTAPFQEHDLPGPDGLTGFLDADLLRRFDPARPPLLRFALLRLGGDRHALVLTLHHLLADGWSLPLLLRELGEHYAGDATRPAPPARAALPRVAGRAGHGRRGGGLAGGARRARSADADRARRRRGRAAHPAPAPHRRPARRADRPDRRAGPRLRPHGEHRAPGRLGRGARRAHRPPRRGVRRHRLGAPARAARRRGDGRALDQHGAGAGPVDAGRRAWPACWPRCRRNRRP
nr:hypothetical protein GCM10020092_037740 [Actinoplanes digitatis]